MHNKTQLSQLSNTDRNALFLVHLNARSLTKNIDAITDFAGSLKPKPTCILITETWLNDLKTPPCIPGYSFAGKSRKNKTGGGVGIFILDGICHKVREDLSSSDATHESFFIEITGRGKNLLIGSVYRPPNTNLHEFYLSMENSIKHVISEKKLVFIGGDFNINLFNQDSNHVSNFVDMMLSYGLLPTISRATRISHQTETLIDNIFTNTDTKIYSGVIMTDNISDHFPIYNNVDIHVGN